MSMYVTEVMKETTFTTTVRNNEYRLCIDINLYDQNIIRKKVSYLLVLETVEITMFEPHTAQAYDWNLYYGANL